VYGLRFSQQWLWGVPSTYLIVANRKSTDILKERVTSAFLTCHLLSRWYLFWPILWTWKWRRHWPSPQHWSIFNNLQVWLCIPVDISFQCFLCHQM
jgi:hypothetical protein